MTDNAKHTDIQEKISASFPQFKQCIQELAEKLNPANVILFGSYATGRERPDSDMDIMLVLDYPLTAPMTRMEATRQARRIFKPVHCPKDILVFRDDELRQWRDSLNHVIGKACREGVVLYARH